MEKYSYKSVTNKRWIDVYVVITDEAVVLLNKKLEEVKHMSRANWDVKVVEMTVMEGWGYKGY
ncbi:MAG: hypothetical protein OEX81_03320 [Candidatus Pacebacteria bacterium]|nr:hypothetical protein [Candidatus Paceibacterota bacterium]